MSLESFRSFISKVSTDLTTVADVQAMQLVQPIRNRLQRKHKYKTVNVLCVIIFTSSQILNTLVWR